MNKKKEEKKTVKKKLVRTKKPLIVGREKDADQKQLELKGL